MFPRQFQLLAILALFVLPWKLLAQDNPLDSVQEIIQSFAAHERELQIVRRSYSYREDIKVQELDKNDKVVGEFQMVREFTADLTGKVTKKVLSAPPSTLKSFQMTPQDFEDIENTQAGVFASGDTGTYDIRYLGKETVNGISCYVFDMRPKEIKDPQRYFEGKIWVEDRGLNIIKSSGKAVPDIRANRGENLFPTFEMYREQIDGYWFPSSIQSLDTLKFSTRSIRIRQITTFSNYKKS
jgi:hypothetical protein